jgi:hypothetical protein
MEDGPMAPPMIDGKQKPCEVTSSGNGTSQWKLSIDINKWDNHL